MMVGKNDEETLRWEISGLIHINCVRFGLKPIIVAAVIVQESVAASRDLFNAIYATRREEGFFRRYLLGKKLTGYIPRENPPTRDTELHGRKYGYGLMQVQGATARENGLDSQYIAALYDPATNIKIGCAYLAKLLRQENGNYREALRRYNGRRPGDYTYVDRIYERIEAKEYEKVLL